MSGWDARFAGKDYYYGEAPAEFLRRASAWLAPGARVLSVADGEGRNSVWLAGQGFDVTAFDASPVALDKARALARRRGVRVEVHEAGTETWDWRPDAFDAVVAVFIQFAAPDQRRAIFEGIARTLRPGGLALLHGFSLRQMANRSGGPRVPEQLWTLPLLREAFPGWQELAAADHDAVLDEGPGHRGPAALIDFVARKPAP